jgi:catechol 1,2-dioxygenase
VGEFGLIVPGIGLEHFIDLYMDAKDREAGAPAEPRAPSKGRFMSPAHRSSKAMSIFRPIPTIPTTLYMSGTITGPDGKPVKGRDPACLARQFARLVFAL